LKSPILYTGVLIGVLLLLAACNPETPVAETSTVASPGSTLFSDDFSSSANASSWGLWNGGGAVVEYHSGGFRILVQESQYDFWSVPGRNFTNVEVETNAVKIGGPDDNDFGIICRYVNKDNFYMLVISSDGYYGIAKIKNGQYSILGTDRLQYSSAIAQGQAANTIRADCVGSALRLYANGIRLTEVNDADFETGDVGLIAGAYSTPGVDILFDNFIVREPN
jgi:hypothetical protein